MKAFHSCKRAAELLSQDLDEPLDWLDRVRLRVHLAMCADCSNVEQQLKAVHSLSADLFSGDAQLWDQAGMAVDEQHGAQSPARRK
ncbi:MAG: zf-HC2 domain-containing protein [Burkholderiaceae bacterium]|nr:MAG: zf-HC2 domain-containing protein [Burkholderiaceae bacterium]TBR76945.1 MAG: zf-HC2 domain-containing protein [Burkholderiaceae bacterium]